MFLDESVKEIKFNKWYRQKSSFTRFCYSDFKIMFNVKKTYTSTSGQEEFNALKNEIKNDIKKIS